MVSQALAPTNGKAVAESVPVTLETLEKVVVGGDLKGLTPAERVGYYRAVCQSLNLNPLTQPFSYITLQGRLTLYANRTATDQLAAQNKVSLSIVRTELDEGIYQVFARATGADGRSVENLGALDIGGLKGEARANAMMKCTTKAFRRTTLSFCGLGWMTTEEVETIPDAQVVTVDQATGEIIGAPASVGKGSKSVPASKELKDRYDKLCHRAADRFLAFKVPEASWDQAMFLAEGKAISEAISGDEKADEATRTLHQKAEMTIDEAQN